MKLTSILVLLSLALFGALAADEKKAKISHVAVGGFLGAGSVVSSNIALFNKTSQTFIPYVGPAFSSGLQAVTVDSSDNVYMAYQPDDISYIYKFNGTSYSRIGSGVNGDVNSLSVIGDKLYVVGNFEFGFNRDQYSVAVLDIAESSVASSYYTNVTNSDSLGNPQKVFIFDDQLTAFNGRFYTVNSDKEWENTQTTSSINFNDFFVEGETVYAWNNGDIYKSTDLETFNAQNVTGMTSLANIVRFNNKYYASASSGLVSYNGSDWNVEANIPSTIEKVVVDGEDLTIIGSIPTVYFKANEDDTNNRYWNRRRLHNVAGFNSGDVKPIYNGGFNAAVHDMYFGKDLVVFRGNFGQAYNLFANGIAGYDSANEKWVNFGAAVDYDRGSINTVAVTQDKEVTTLFVGGNFERSENKTVMAIAKVDNVEKTFTALGAGLQRSNNADQYAEPGTVYAIKVIKDEVFVGGLFDRSGETALMNFAKFNQETSEWFNLAGGIKGLVIVFEETKNGLIVGGIFDKAGSLNVANIVEFNTKTNQFSPLGSGLNGPVLSLAKDKNDIIACGDFDSAGGRSAQGLAVWKGNHWEPLMCAGNEPCEYYPTGTRCKQVKVFNGKVYFIDSNGEFRVYDDEKMTKLGSGEIEFSGSTPLVSSPLNSGNLWTFGNTHDTHFAGRNEFGEFDPSTENWLYNTQGGFSSAPTFVSSGAMTGVSVALLAILSLLLF